VRVIRAGACLLLVSLGCGPSTGGLAGSVTFRDKALPGASVAVLDSKGAVHQGEVDNDGKYVITGVAAGPAKVSVNYVDPKVEEYARLIAKGSRDPKNVGKSQPRLDKSKILTIPANYSDFEQSGFVTTIAGGTETKLDLAIK
jgi:hypothetical protein